MANEPGAAILAIFDQLIDRIKQRNPLRTDSKPLNTRVYSQLVLGMPIWRDDYLRPWSPSGGSSLRDVFHNGPAAPPAVAGGAAPAAAADPQFLLAMQAAWKTSLLCRTMLKVTKDDEYREYPIGRHLDFAYESVMAGMQPGPSPELAPDVKKRIAEAEKVLYVPDQDGNPTSTATALYKDYKTNAAALATAKSNFAVAFALKTKDPALAEVWPIQSAALQELVDQARNDLVSQGGATIEQALDTLASVGRPIQEHMVAKARDTYDAWDLNLSGSVPARMPYSMILPTNWCDPDDHDGWETLTVEQSSYQSYSSLNATSASQSSWLHHAESTGGGGGVLLGFAAFGGSHSSGSVDNSWQNSSNMHFESKFHNTSHDLRIELEFGLCSIVRPWLISDLFYMKDWYMKGAKKNSISDGTIDGQVDSQEKLLPMIPQQFLVVRNVKISTSDWGADGDLLSAYYGSAQGSDHSDDSSTAGSGGVCLGFISFGGSASHSDENASGQSSSFQSRSADSYFGTTFDGETLHIPGAQIVAFLSDICPATPDLDDPTLPH